MAEARYTREEIRERMTSEDAVLAADRCLKAGYGQTGIALLAAYGAAFPQYSGEAGGEEAGEGWPAEVFVGRGVRWPYEGQPFLSLNRERLARAAGTDEMEVRRYVPAATHSQLSDVDRREARAALDAFDDHGDYEAPVQILRELAGRSPQPDHHPECSSHHTRWCDCKGMPREVGDRG